MARAYSVPTAAHLACGGTQARLQRLLSEASFMLEHDIGTARALLSEAVVLLRDPLRDPLGADPAAGATDPARGGLAAWQAKRVARHVEHHLHRTISVAELAALVRLSRTHFASAFRGSFGTSPHAYVLERRVARAKQLMLETDMPLSEIACACGLCDQAHLSRLFRRFEGRSPLLWRRAWQERPRSATAVPAAAGHDGALAA